MPAIHFIRPQALWLLFPLLGITAGLLFTLRENKKWQTLIPCHLRPWLFSKGSPASVALPLLTFLLATSLAILALAGPAWKKMQLPGEKIKATVLVAIDISQSMLATDIPPNRLERAKFKLIDFLDANPRIPVGLLAFAGTAHPVLPFTTDYSLIKSQAASLAPHIMPVPGINYQILLEAFDSLVKDSPGSIFLITGVIDPNDAARINNFMQTNHRHLEILLLSTPSGAPIPGHPSAQSKQDPTALHRLAMDTSITITPLTLDNSDVVGIASRIAKKLVFEKTGPKDQNEWLDEGQRLLIPILLLTLLGFRKGWVIQWCWPLLILPALSSCGVRSRHPDWWFSNDYQGQQLADAGRYEDAANRFDDDEHKAVALYKSGNYEAAADLFALVGNADADYNRSLALTHLGRYAEALKALDSAVAYNPLMASKAALLRQAIRQKDSLSLDPIKKIPPTAKKDSTPQKEHKPESEDEKLSSDTRVKQLPTSGNRITDETQSNIHGAKEAKTPPNDFSKQNPAQDPEQVILRQSAADPAEFLHRRFKLQLKRYSYNKEWNKEQKVQKQPR
jgi:Ca-activated chloride channel family protein